MIRWLVGLFVCLSLSLPCFSSPIDQGLLNNWSPKKFRAAIRRVQGERGLGARNSARENYLHRAVRLNRPVHLSLLLATEELQEEVTRRNHDALTAIELSLFLGRTNCFLTLLNHLENPNFRVMNTYRWTLLHLAARYNRTVEIRALVARGAAVNAYDETEQHWTPLDVARHAQADDAIAVLRELGGEEVQQIPQTQPQEEVNETIPAILQNPVRTHPQLDLIHYELVGPEEDDLYHQGPPLSDFALGPLAARLGAAALFLFFFVNQIGLAGGGGSQ